MIRLDKDDLRLALRLVNLLNESLSEANQTLNEVVQNDGAIYIPDSDCVLRSASELCYNEPECHWVPTGKFASSHVEKKLMK